MINEKNLTLIKVFNNVSDRLKEAGDNNKKCELELDGDYVYWEGYSAALDWVHDMLICVINDNKKKKLP